MTVPSPGWMFVIVGILLTAILGRITLRRLSLRRLDRLKEAKHLFDDLTDAPEDAPDPKKDAKEQIKVYHHGLKRVLFFFLALGLLLVVSIPYFSTLPAAFVSFFLGALTLVIGTAAKPVIENFISGIVLAFSQTINIGDTVLLDGEHYGTIEELGYTHSVVKIWDWRRYVIPNSEMLSKSFLNYSLKDNFQHAYIEFWVAPDADLELVEKICIEEPKKSKHFVPYEDPALWVMGMDKDAIHCWAGAWADSPSDAWMLKSDMRNSLIKAFAENGIKTQGMRLVHDPGETPILNPPQRKKTGDNSN